MEAFECIYVEWVDAMAECDWEEITESRIHKCRSLGFLVYEDELTLCIASVVSAEDRMSNAKIHIPKAWITKEKRIKID